MEKRAKYKLVRSPRENGGGWDAQKDLHSRIGRDENKGKTQEKMERGSRKRSSSAGSEKMESWWQIGKNGRKLFDMPRPTVGCSANGRRRRIESNTFSRVRGVVELFLQTTHPPPLDNHTG